jgi:succinate dehydrogenase / fumarate reductase, cytochrome b subunit
MTSVARPARVSRLAVFWDSSVGKKIVMGATGLVMVGYLVVHMAGNLQLFLGRETINRYAAILHTSEELLWVVRIVLIASVILHVIAAYQLTMRDRAARPIGYRKHERQSSTIGSRLMRWGGVLILVFIPLHLLNFTTGGWHPAFEHGDVYGNLVYAFEQWPLLAAFYLVVMVFVGFHLYHGAWAMLRTLGVAKPSANPLQRRFVSLLAWVVAVGFVSVPVAIVLGLVR